MIYELKHIFKDRIHSQAVYSYNSKLQIHYIHIHKEPNIISLSKHASHEALHATFQILQDKGITYTESSEESYTYLQQYILEHILTNILTPTTDQWGFSLYPPPSCDWILRVWFLVLRFEIFLIGYNHVFILYVGSHYLLYKKRAGV